MQNYWQRTDRPASASVVFRPKHNRFIPSQRLSYKFTLLLSINPICWFGGCRVAQTNKARGADP
jgi:hypothetical protein